jgi:hypothetical protein
MDLSNYVVKDFVLNESFQKWILQPDDEIQFFWTKWLTNHPEKYEVIMEAKLFIQNIHTSIEEHIGDSFDVWNEISDSLENFEVADKTLDKGNRDK